MIYVGDGPSDIPCFSMIKSLRGSVVGVMPPGDKDLRKPYELSQGDRLTIDHIRQTTLRRLTSVRCLADMCVALPIAFWSIERRT